MDVLAYVCVYVWCPLKKGNSYAYVRVHTCMYLCVYVCILRMYVCMRLRTCVLVCVDARVCVCVCTCMCVSRYVYILTLPDRGRRAGRPRQGACCGAYLDLHAVVPVGQAQVGRLGAHP